MRLVYALIGVGILTILYFSLRFIIGGPPTICRGHIEIKNREK